MDSRHTGREQIRSGGGTGEEPGPFNGGNTRTGEAGIMVVECGSGRQVVAATEGPASFFFLFLPF